MDRMTNYFINCCAAEINFCVIVTINRFDRRRNRRIDSVLIRATFVYCSRPAAAISLNLFCYVATREIR